MTRSARSPRLAGPRRWLRTLRRRGSGRGRAARPAWTPTPAAGPGIRPVFVGGTGRSGTTIVGRLLGAHPDYRLVPFEIKFLTGNRGLCDLVEGNATYDQFRKLMLGRWYDSVVPTGTRRGVARFLERAAVVDALDALRDELDGDRFHAGAGFVHRLLDPLAIASGAGGWVEMTPTNIISGERLLRIFPDAKLVHVIRDGRDVACSVVQWFWGPNDVDEALDWWAERLEKGLMACERLPADRYLVVGMENLVAGDREGEYARLLAFLGVDDEAAIRAFFETSVGADRAHIGRWTEQVPPERRASFEAHHAALVEQLRARGRSLPSPSGALAEG